MEGLISKMIYFALIVILIAAVWKCVSAYLSGKTVKSEIKNFIVICIFLGAAPGLTTVASGLGESIVTPLQSIVTFVSSEITNELSSTSQGN